MNQKREEESTSDSDSQDEILPSKVRSETKTKSSEPNMAVHTKFKTRAKRPGGRLCKRKTRRNVRIKGLDAIDFLHSRTVLSTTTKGVGPKSPPPPGCVDYQFTALTAMAADTVPIHTELPPATYETPYALQVLLDMYREQYLAMIRCMKSDDFRKNVEIQIIEEKEKKQKLTSKLEQLEKQINQLISDSLKLLQTRMAEIGISNGSNPRELIAKAKEIMSQHHELQGEAVELNCQIPFLEGENAQLLTDSVDEKFEVPSPGSSTAHCDDDPQSSLQIPIQHVKSEPLEDDTSLSNSYCQSDAVDFSVGTQTIEPSEAYLRTTPFSIVLPRILDSPSVVLPRIEDVTAPKLLTPAQKKFACDESQMISRIQNSPSDTLSLNNENKPPSEKRDSTRKHRHKKSHKSKRKHKQHEHNQHELKAAKPIKTESFATPSYSNVIVDPIEDIITKTLNADSASSYPGREVSINIAPVTNYSGHSVSNSSDREKMELSDYRRVPPMKIALKKFAQENNGFPNPHPSSAMKQSHSSSSVRNSHSSSVIRTTVGDLVCCEIEKSLEISNRSIVSHPPAALVYNSHIVHNRPQTQRSPSDRRATRGNESHEEFSSKSPYSVVPRPSDVCRKTVPESREEPLEGLAASIFGTMTSHRSPEEVRSRHSFPHYPSPVNPEFRMSDPGNTVPHYGSSSLTQLARLPNEHSTFADQRNQADDNRWQDVSMHFDRMFEFVSNKIVSQENVPSKDKLRSKLRNPTADNQSPTFSLNPPSLFRADSSFADSPPMPDLPVSPASLEGPFSPVPSLSPPALASPVSSTNEESKDGNSTFYEKSRPKGREWKWP